MVLNGEEGLECEILGDKMLLGYVSEFKDISFFSTNQVQMSQCSRKVSRGRKFAGAFKSLVNVKGQQLECGKALLETLLVSFLIYNSEKIILKEKERSRIRAVQMDNFRGLLGN